MHTVAEPLRGRLPVAMAGLLAAFVISSCLGPDELDPTGASPVGRLELVHGSGASIRVVGWALDPDTARPIEVAVGVGGATTLHRADRHRPDVAERYPRHGAAHGFDVRTGPLPRGRHDICVWAPNVGRGDRDRLLGCRTVQTTSDDPVGGFDHLGTPRPGVLAARGWAFDAEASGPVTVSLTLDGEPASRRPTSVARADLSTFFHTSAPLGFDVELDVEAGPRRVCATAHNVGRGRDVSLGCRTVVVAAPPDAAPVVAPGADVVSLDAVGPPPGHPLARIDRDAGISVQLGDGSLLWLFADSTQRHPDGGLAYFVNNTAAWASAQAPTVTLDAVSQSGAPHAFVVPVEPFSDPCPPGRSPVMWPLSAVAVPHAETGGDRVLAYVGNVCLGGDGGARSRGVALVEWIHDPSDPPAGRPIQGTVLNQELFGVDAHYGTASVVVDGVLHAYACGRPADERTDVAWPDDPDWSGCTVARVAPEDAHDRSAYRYWAGGTTWSASPAAAAAMVLPAPAGDRQTPVASFSVVQDPHHGFLMVHSPWPGFTDEVAVRRAPGPTGPWSQRTVRALPGCTDTWSGTTRYCYAAGAHPWRSDAGTLGIGWYDQLVAVGPERGGYLVGSSPFAPSG